MVLEVIDVLNGIFGIVGNANEYKEIAEYFGLGTGGVLILRLLYPLLSKLKLCDCKEKLDELTRVQNATISDIKEYRITFAEFLEEFSDMVARIDNLESLSNDFKVEVDEALRVGDDRMDQLSSSQIKNESRLVSLESEDKELNKLIAKLSEETTYLSATIGPMKEDIRGLKKSSDKTNDLLMQMNNNISLLMGRLGGV